MTLLADADPLVRAALAWVAALVVTGLIVVIALRRRAGRRRRGPRW
jgi:hypothetical protein